MRNQKEIAKEIINTVAFEECILAGATVVDEIIDNQFDNNQYQFINIKGGYDIVGSEIIISSLSLLVACVALGFDIFKHRKDELKDKSDEEIDIIIIENNQDFKGIEKEKRLIIIKMIKEND